ncbi:MAG TPA: efflux RND transporter periplasmic adaptor subunit [Terriglobales bacterium]|nr:efflux RND transporter periplasmic adaptor subunit [Terriglobales bacterium]
MSSHVEVTPARSTGSPPSSPAPRRALALAVIVLLILAVAGAVTVFSRLREEKVLAKDTDAAAIPIVSVIHATAEKPEQELVLPGTLQAYVESPIYARTSGYLEKWYKDIGSRVNKGELLADIATPEVDQELMQARAAVRQQQSALGIAQISASRWQELRKSDSVSQQETDQRNSDLTTAQANLAAAEANLKRLEQLESFKHVYAPFSGVITKRNVDPGALINAGATGREMFDIAQMDPLRVYINVPQSYGPEIKVGSAAYATLEERPGLKFAGKIARTADAIDPSSRTLLTEVDIPNKDGRLLPGSFGQVHFAVKAEVQKFVVPVNALIFRAQGPQLAVVGQDGKAHLRSIAIGQDYGASLEVLTGVDASDRIIINPPDSLEEGQAVNVAAAATEDGRS